MNMHKPKPKHALSVGKINSGTIFNLVLMLAWLHNTVVAYVLTLVGRMPYIGVPITTVYPFVLWVLVFLSLPWMCRRLGVFELLLYSISAIIVFGTPLIYPAYTELIDSETNRILVVAIPMIFIGVCYDHKRHQNLLFFSSILGSMVPLAYQVYQLMIGRELEMDSMHHAYLAVPHILYLLYVAADRKETKYWVIALLGSFTIFVYGTRGPLLCILVFLSICLLMKIRTTTSGARRVLFTILVVGLLLVTFSGDWMIKISQTLSRVFGNIGFSTRIFDFYIEGEIADGTGRERLIPRALSLLQDSPLWGYGLMGDRFVLGRYPHNMFVELWFQFGYLLGTVILVAFWIPPIMALYKTRHDRSCFLCVCALLCLGYIKVLLSSSYIVEPYLFFALGACLSILRQSRATCLREGDAE